MTRPSRTVRGAVRGTVLAALLALVAGLLVPTPIAVAAPAGVSVEPVSATVVPGGRLYFAGYVDGSGARARRLVVEQLRDRRWVAVARTRSNASNRAYYVDLRAPRRTGMVSWRVVAPRAGAARRLVSRVVRQRVVRQRVTWQLPATARIGTRVEARVRVGPFVPAQSVTLQQEVNGRWQYVGDRVLGRRGATIPFTQVTAGPSRFRLVGPDQQASVQTLTGTPSGVRHATRRLSVTTNGSQLGGASYDASVSDDGRLVAFTSAAANAVPGDSNGKADVFVKNTVTGTLRLISRGSRGTPGSGDSFTPTISGDGRVVAFVSRARNLDGPDLNRQADVFLWDATTGKVSRVGTAGSDPVLSRDGRYVAFTSADDGQVEDADDNESADVMLYDRRTASLSRVSSTPDGVVGDARSVAPSISADGRYVAFATEATNLTPEATPGVLLWDRTTGESRLVAAGPAGQPEISADASAVAFESRSTDLDPAGRNQVYLRDLEAATTTLLSTADGSMPGNRLSRLASISADGSVVLFSSDADLVADDEDRDYCESESECYTDEYRTDAYVADVASGDVTLVSRSSTGEASDFFAEGLDLLADGSAAVFGSRDVLVPGQSTRDRFGSVYSYLEVFVRDLG